MGLIRMPILLIPFLRQSAERVGHKLYLCENAIGLRIDVIGDLCSHIEQLGSLHIGHIAIEVGSLINNDPPLKPKTCRFHTSMDTLTQLDKLGSRTYVPETEASRMSGAGAGASDHD